MNLEGKVVLITGGSMGLGASIAQRLVADGAKVCITARTQETLDKCAKSLPSGKVVTCAGDVTKQADCKRMVETTLAFGGKLDVLVNNAALGQFPPATVVDLDPDFWYRIMDVNLNGPFLMMKESIPHMVKAGNGSIINIASGGGLMAFPGSPAYCSSKGGLIMLTKQVALDFGPFNVRCNVVCPGAIATHDSKEMMEQMAAQFPQIGANAEEIFAKVFRNTPLGRISTPEEYGGICSYLASDDASYTNGAVIVVDGGAGVVEPNGVEAVRTFFPAFAAGKK
jgi:NAD(P)-dependent dehydrogenase (short-subunit alcohol dehydrogenase family)